MALPIRGTPTTCKVTLPGSSWKSVDRESVLGSLKILAVGLLQA